MVAQRPPKAAKAGPKLELGVKVSQGGSKCRPVQSWCIYRYLGSISTRVLRRGEIHGIFRIKEGSNRDFSKRLFYRPFRNTKRHDSSSTDIFLVLGVVASSISPILINSSNRFSKSDHFTCCPENCCDSHPLTSCIINALEICFKERMCVFVGRVRRIKTINSAAGGSLRYFVSSCPMPCCLAYLSRVGMCNGTEGKTSIGTELLKDSEPSKGSVSVLLRRCPTATLCVAGNSA